MRTGPGGTEFSRDAAGVALQRAGATGVPRLMTKPVILAVDDDREVLGAVERDLRQRYREDYRVIAAQSSRQALDTAHELKRRGTPVALFLVDQRMPDMTGTEFLREVRKLSSRRQADAADRVRRYRGGDRGDQRGRARSLPDEAVGSAGAAAVSGARRSARASGRRTRGRRSKACGCVGSRWSPQSYAARDFLSRNQIPVSVDRHRAGRADARARALGERRRPVATAGRAAARRHDARRADAARSWPAKVGLQTVPARPFYDLAIIGGGPAGLACAVYGASEGLQGRPRSSRTRRADRRARAR